MKSQVAEQCRSCGSRHLAWERDNGWLTGSIRYLRCQRCSDCIRTNISGSTWIMFLIALTAAVAGWWSVIR